MFKTLALVRLLFLHSCHPATTSPVEACTKLASDCTAKAVENRLYSWKKKNTSGSTNLNTATSTPTKKVTTPKTPGSRQKATPRKKKEQLDEDSDGPQDLFSIKQDSLSPTPAHHKRKADQTSCTESQSEDGDIEGLYTPKKSKVKMEPTEDWAILGLDDAFV